MTRRRNFGTTRQLASGRWQARYRLRSGDRVTAPLTFHTKSEAVRWLAIADADRARGIWLDPRAGRVALSDYAWQWLASKPRLAPRTREIYEGQLRLYVLPEITTALPALGTVAIADITPELVRGWYASLAASRSASTAAKAYARLKQILNQAVSDDRIAKNPCRIASGSVERHPEQRFASLSEVHAVAAAVPPRYRALVLSAAYAGLRQGELFALRRLDVDLLHGTITVRRKRLRLASGKVIEDDPKSEAGRRRVALPPVLVSELEAHMRAFTARKPDAYVFATSSGLPMERNNFRNRVWVPAIAATGLTGLRFHDLRHTAGTLAARAGATTKELMARLGHASPRAAMMYQHATEERDREIAARLGAMAVDAGLAPVVPIRARQ